MTDETGTRDSGKDHLGRPVASNQIAHGLTVTKGRVYGNVSRLSVEPKVELQIVTDDFMSTAHRFLALEAAMKEKLDTLNSLRSFWVEGERGLYLSISDCIFELTGNNLSIRHPLGSVEGIPPISDTLTTAHASRAALIINYINPTKNIRVAALEAAREHLTKAKEGI